MLLYRTQNKINFFKLKKKTEKVEPENLDKAILLMLQTDAHSLFLVFGNLEDNKSKGYAWTEPQASE